MFQKAVYSADAVPGFGDPIPPGKPAPAPPSAPKRGKRGSARKGQGKGVKRAARAGKAPRAKQTRRGPAPLSLDVAQAFELLQGCKKKDMAAIQGVAALLNPLNRKARQRVMDAVKAIQGE